MIANSRKNKLTGATGSCLSMPILKILLRSVDLGIPYKTDARRVPNFPLWISDTAASSSSSV